VNETLRNLLCLEDDGLHVRGLCSFGGGGSTNTVQQADPWSGQQPYLQDIYNIAAQNFSDHQPGPAYYPGSTYAPMSADQYGIASRLIGNGVNGGGPALQSAQSAVTSALSPGYTAQTSAPFAQSNDVLSNELSPGYLNPWNSPSFNTVVNNTLAKAIPAATSSFTNGNRGNSGLQTRAATMAATDSVGQLAQNQYQANQAIQNSAQQQAASNYLTQQGNQIKMGALAPLIDQTATSDLSTALNAAGLGQQDTQNSINAAMQQWNYGQMLPWNQLSLFENAINGTGSPGGTTTTSQPYFSNTAANVMGGVSTAAALASAAAMIFSDERVKKDIHKIGVSDSGFPLYFFRYKGEGPASMHIGVMAQDVEKRRPDAVSHTPEGIKMVDYAKALAR
jgi:endosialidase-like protein